VSLSACILVGGDLELTGLAVEQNLEVSDIAGFKGAWHKDVHTSLKLFASADTRA